MNVLITSEQFLPSIGGVQTLVTLFAREILRFGHDVTVLTRQASSGADRLSYRVVRQPTAIQTLKWFRWADASIQFAGLRLGWPTLVSTKPTIIGRQIIHTGGEHGMVAGALKQCWRRRAIVVVPSQGVARFATEQVDVVPNCFDAEIFAHCGDAQKTRDIAFVGRLVPEKGVNIFLDALSLLRKKQFLPKVTIIGEGPEAPRLRRQSHECGVADQVDFVGPRSAGELADTLARHEIVVVPSVWEEAFGIVALEGIACGCVIVGSHCGGLPEAIGPCGVTFPKGDSATLADCLADLLEHPEKVVALRAGAADHLFKHSPATVAKRYLDILKLQSSPEA